MKSLVVDTEMNKKIKIGSGGTLTLTDKSFYATGGEGSIYVVNGNQALKIYHDINKIPPIDKIKELSVINNISVITPKDIIYDISTGDNFRIFY